jgi:hypothetical protein
MVSRASYIALGAWASRPFTRDGPPNATSLDRLAQRSHGDAWPALDVASILRAAFPNTEFDRRSPRSIETLVRVVTLRHRVEQSFTRTSRIAIDRLASLAVCAVPLVRTVELLGDA